MVPFLPSSDDNEFWDVEELSAERAYGKYGAQKGQVHSADKHSVDMLTQPKDIQSDDDVYVLDKEARTIFCQQTRMGYRFRPDEVILEEGQLTVVKGRNKGKVYKVVEIV